MAKQANKKAARRKGGAAKKSGAQKEASTRDSRRSSPKARTSGVRPDLATVLKRIARLEEVLDGVRGQLFYERHAPVAPERNVVALTGQNRFVRSTADGWLAVMISGARTSLPSGLNVTLLNTANGRDHCKINEGVLKNQTFDVSAGNLAAEYSRVTDLRMRVAARPGGPVQIDGVSYDLQMTLRFQRDGAPQTRGPYPAKTLAQNPLPVGDHDLEIADYPHEPGAGYGAHGTVWFRIGHTGDRYVHPGRVSAGCLTCSPSHWEELYAVLHCAREDAVNVGRLVVA